MAFWAEVRVDKVTCRDPESSTAPDNFVFVGGVITREADTRSAYVSPLRRLRANESASYHETIFAGITEDPSIGLVLRAWDKDLNTRWYETKEEIESIKNSLQDGFKGAGEVIEDILAFSSDFILLAVDLAVKFDFDDELLNYADWISLSDAPFSGIQTRELEIRFSRPDSTPLAGSWDYSLFVTLSYHQIPPGLGTSRPPSWVPMTNSRLQDWVGTWSSHSAPGRGKPAISAVISRSAIPELLNVSLTRQAIYPDGKVHSTTRHYPRVAISKVFLEAGTAVTESVGVNFAGEALTAGPAASPLPYPSGPIVRQPYLNIFNERPANGGRVIARETSSGYGFRPGAIVLREQIGTDFIRLTRSTTILQIFRDANEKTGTTQTLLQYLDPVLDERFPDAGAQESALLIPVISIN